ncbi:hypothetical protein Tco_0861034 [Tanacetum coccineum]|uniref:Uncharacterized protein n=1 Tax=Tanacetum coccineum TaxID=301880 RepID=A0ABQ5BJQ6_9ASTR
MREEQSNKDAKIYSGSATKLLFALLYSPSIRLEISLYNQDRDLVLRRKKKKSLDYNNSFLDEYECSSLALDREERRDENKRLDHLKQDQTILVIKRFSEKKKVFRVIKKTGKIRAKREETRGGKVTAMGGKVTAKGGKVSATPSKPSASTCTPHPGFEMSTPDTASSATSGGAIKLREGVWIRSPEKERSSNADSGSSSMNKLRTVNGKVVSSRGRRDGSKSRMYPGGIRPIGFSNSMGLSRHAWSEGITPEDCIIHAQSQSEIALSQSQPITSQDQELRQQATKAANNQGNKNQGNNNQGSNNQGSNNQ